MGFASLKADNSTSQYSASVPEETSVPPLSFVTNLQNSQCFLHDVNVQAINKNVAAIKSFLFILSGFQFKIK